MFFRYFAFFRDPDFIAKAFENVKIRENIILNTDLTNLTNRIISRIWELENIIFYMMSFILTEELLKVHSQDTSKEKQLIICNNLPIYFFSFFVISRFFVIQILLRKNAKTAKYAKNLFLLMIDLWSALF